MAQEIIQQVEIIPPADKAAEIIEQQQLIIKMLDETEQNLKTKTAMNKQRFEEARVKMEGAKGKLRDIKQKLTEINVRVQELKASQVKPAEQPSNTPEDQNAPSVPNN